MLQILFVSVVNAATNTNACLQLLPSIRGCFSSTAGNCPTNLANFNNARCFCNDLTNRLLEVPYPTAMAVLAGSYGIRPSCNGFETRTYNSGQCLQTDTQLDASRFFAAQKFSETIFKLGLQSSGCLDYDRFRAALTDSVLPDAVGQAGQGLGIYRSADHIAEYFSLLSPRINHGFVNIVPAPNAEKVAYITPDGSTVTVGTTILNYYLNGAYQRNPSDYLETVFEFSGCNTRVTTVKVPSRSTLFPNRVTGVPSLAEMLHVTANSDLLVGGNSFSMLGFRSTCFQHEKYCTGANRQFATMSDCINMLRALPRKSPTCGKQSLLTGNTIACRAKHQFMTQIDPETHCKHIGLNSPACSDSLCEVPGFDTDVNDQVANLNPQLTSALYNINEFYRVKMSQNAWEYADYCPLQVLLVRIIIPGPNKILSLTEVQLTGADPVRVTVSSEAYGRDPNLLINGRIDGSFWNGDVTHTNVEDNPTVGIRLEHGGKLEEVTVYGRTDCCTDRMAGMVAQLKRGDGVILKQSPFRLVDAATQKYVAFGKTYLKLYIPGDGKILHLSEVVVDGISATASSAAYGTNPNTLLNGRIDGNWFNGDVFHSNAESNPWVKIELAKDNPTDVVIFGRTDCCSDRMAGMMASVEYADGTVIKSAPLRLIDAASQKYLVFPKVFLKLSVPGYLHLTEVTVEAVSITASSAAFGTNPNVLINGKIDGNWANGDVFHTDYSAMSWVKIELAQDNVSNVIIWGRTDCCSDRMNGMVATLEYADGTVIKSSPVRLLDAATQRYVAWG